MTIESGSRMPHPGPPEKGATILAAAAGLLLLLLTVLHGNAATAFALAGVLARAAVVARLAPAHPLALVLAGALVPRGLARAAALALALVLAGTRVLVGLATALALALVVALADVLVCGRIRLLRVLPGERLGSGRHSGDDGAHHLRELSAIHSDSLLIDSRTIRTALPL
jgi:hypothetical protein